MRWLVSLYYEFEFWLRATPLIVAAAAPRVRCAQCGGPMVLMGFVPPRLYTPPPARIGAGLPSDFDSS